MVEYGDFECPICRQAAPAVKMLLQRFRERVQFVFRHFPLEALHPHALHAAQAAESAGAQGQFWPMHDLLFANQEHLQLKHLRDYAGQLELDMARFDAEMRDEIYLQRIREHIDGGRRSHLKSTPGFFVNGVIVDVSFGLHAVVDATAAALEAAARETKRIQTGVNMEPNLPPSLAKRRDQIFPSLSEQEIARMQRFGSVHSYASGAAMVTAGVPAPGLQVMLSGSANVTPHDEHLRDRPVVDYGPGSLVGELTGLSGGTSLVDVIANTEVRALLIATPRLRDLMVEEVELGERIMRALILRRVALLESAVVGPIIVGRETNRDVLRLESFLNNNGYPHRRFDPDSDSCARTLLERFAVSRAELPIVLCPNGQLLRNPTENQLARCLGLVQLVNRDEVYDVAIVGAGPAGLGAAVYAASEGLKVVVHRLPRLRRSGGRLGPYRELSRLSDGDSRSGA